MSDKPDSTRHHQNHEHDAPTRPSSARHDQARGEEHHHTQHEHSMPSPTVAAAPDAVNDRDGGVLAGRMDAGAAETTPSHSSHGAHAEHSDHTTTAPNGHSGHNAHTGHTDHTGHELMFRNRFWVCLLLTLPVLLYSHMLQMWFGFTVPAFPGSMWVGPLFAFMIFIYGGVPFIQMAGPELRARRPGMMTLISLAIIVAFVYSIAALWIDPAGGFFWEMALLIDVMLLGHWLEMRSVRQASGALNELAKLMPDDAERLRTDGSTETVPTSELRVGDLLLVRPGASVPADGEVVEGESHVNEAMITGESKPVGKEPHSRVIAGTVNGDGSLRVRVTAIGQETALAGIMRLVEQAQNSKSPTQVLADRAAGWLFYIALAAAILTALVWIWGEWFKCRGRATGRYSVGHCLPPCPRIGGTAGGCHQHIACRAQWYPRA